MSFQQRMRDMNLEVIKHNYFKLQSQIDSLTDSECVEIHQQLKKDYSVVFKVMQHHALKKFKDRPYDKEKLKAAREVEQVMNNYDNKLLPRVLRLTEDEDIED